MQVAEFETRSPNTLRVAYALHLKGIPYHSVFVNYSYSAKARIKLTFRQLSYPDIAENHKSLGIPKDPEGFGYTCAAISTTDSSGKKVALQDGFRIIEWVEKGTQAAVSESLQLM